MISICVTIKNRSRVTVEGSVLTLFPRCVASIVAAAVDLPEIELVVSDWGSDDWPLERWLPHAVASLQLQVIQVGGEFSRGRGRNVAANAASGDQLFFIDADCLISPGILERSAQIVAAGNAYFPILYSFSDPGHTAGWWRHEGFGNCMLSRATVDKSGGWPEYHSWGKGDDHFLDRIRAVADVVREELPGFYQQWHPDDLEWKDRLVVQPPHVLAERHAATLAARELARLISTGNTLILVDEARFGAGILSRELRGRRILPFVEREGVYWGAPVDDYAAVAEVERQQREYGATFLAFAWTAFWWLDYYTALRQYLRSRFPCVMENERLIVFDLRRTQ